MKKFTFVALAIAAAGFGSAASSATMVLDSTTQCSTGYSSNNIAVGNVTGNSGGASECWGTFDGNDPGPSAGGFQIGSTVYDFVAKENIGGSLEGADIGLSVSSGTSGTWAFDATKWGAAGYGDFIIVLKAANSPGFASWLFSGAAADSTSGNWSVAWTTGNGGANPNLSHLSVYAADSISTVPLPAAGWMLLAGLGGLAASRRKKKS